MLQIGIEKIMNDRQQFDARKDPRRGRNVAVALSIAGFMAVVFAVTIIRMQGG